MPALAERPGMWRQQDDDDRDDDDDDDQVDLTNLTRALAFAYNNNNNDMVFGGRCGDMAIWWRNAVEYEAGFGRGVACAIWKGGRNGHLPTVRKHAEQ